MFPTGHQDSCPSEQIKESLQHCSPQYGRPLGYGPRHWLPSLCLLHLLQLTPMPALERHRAGVLLLVLTCLLLEDEWPFTHWKRQANRIFCTHSWAYAHFGLCHSASADACLCGESPVCSALPNQDVAWGCFSQALERKLSEARYACADADLLQWPCF